MGHRIDKNNILLGLLKFLVGVRKITAQLTSVFCTYLYRFDDLNISQFGSGKDVSFWVVSKQTNIDIL